MQKQWKWIITTLIVLLALFISVKSFRLSENALEITREQFLQINKPYLSLKPIKYKNDNYFKIDQQDNIVMIKFQFELKNLGNVAAINVHPPNKMAVPKKLLGEGSVLQYGLPPNVVLAPGNRLILVSSLKFLCESVTRAKEYVAEMNIEKQGITIYIPVNYESEIESDNTFQIIEGYIIKRNSARVIKSEMKRLDKNTPSGQIE